MYIFQIPFEEKKESFSLFTADKQERCKERLMLFDYLKLLLFYPIIIVLNFS